MHSTDEQILIPFIFLCTERLGVDELQTVRPQVVAVNFTKIASASGEVDRV
jgi:hypothetical protein